MMFVRLDVMTSNNPSSITEASVASAFCSAGSLKATLTCRKARLYSSAAFGRRLFAFGLLPMPARATAPKAYDNGEVGGSVLIIGRTKSRKPFEVPSRCSTKLARKKLAALSSMGTVRVLKTDTDDDELVAEVGVSWNIPFPEFSESLR